VTHLNHTIRVIANRLVGGEVTDLQITTVAKAGGWAGPITSSLNDLDFLERFMLGKYMVSQAERSGLSIEQIARLLSEQFIFQTKEKVLKL